MSAGDRARRLYPASKAHRTAYRKGAAARVAGRTLAACPYRQRGGYGSSFRLAWLGGFQSEAEEGIEEGA